MAYLRKGSSKWWITVATRTPGEYVHLATGTRDKATAEAMEAMWRVLGPAGQRRWDLLEPVRAGDCRLNRLFDAYVQEGRRKTNEPSALDQLREELDDVDLAEGVLAWDRQLEDQYRGETPRKYRQQIHALFALQGVAPRVGQRGRPKGVGKGGRPAGERVYAAASRATVLAPGYIAKKLADVGGSRTSRRRYHEAWTSCFEFLKDRGLVERNPMKDVRKPKPDRSKTPHLDLVADVLKLVESFEEPDQRAAAALREGAGMEIQSVVAMCRRDVVDVAHRIVWAHGRKNDDWRDRQVLVDAELWPFFWAWVEEIDRRGAGPEAPLFQFTDDTHRRRHSAVCARLRADGMAIPVGYTPHAARHTYAIRHMRANDEVTLISNNLGHADSTEVLRLYGKYRPKITDIRRAGQPRREED